MTPRKTIPMKNHKYRKDDIYKHNGDKFYKVNDVRDLEYDNKTFRKYIKELHNLNNSYAHLEEVIYNHKEKIKTFLESVTSANQGGDLESLISLLGELLVINNTKKYNMIELDDDGYIKTILPINGIILENDEYPNDILKGYYKIVNNKAVIDEDRFYNLYDLL